mgnify:FL=1|jgi:hypothetical protein
MCLQVYIRVASTNILNTLNIAAVLLHLTVNLLDPSVVLARPSGLSNSILLYFVFV